MSENQFQTASMVSISWDSKSEGVAFTRLLLGIFDGNINGRCCYMRRDASPCQRSSFVLVEKYGVS